MSVRTAVISLFFGLFMIVGTASTWLFIAGEEGLPLPVIDSSPRFTLTDSNGNPLSNDELRGKVWLGNFFFTSCSGICPLISRNVASVAKEFAGDEGVAFLSVSVDPTRDTPQVLTQYAEHIRPNGVQWYFTTGTKQDLRNLLESGFKLPYEDDSALHTTRAVLVDAKHRIRGYYDALEPEALKLAASDIRRLLKEKR